MKRDFNAWLASLGPIRAGQVAGRAARSGTTRTSSAGAMKYGQANLDISDEMDLERRSRAVRGRSGEGPPAAGDARYRRGDPDASGSTRCCSRAAAAPADGGAPRLSDRDRAVRAGPQRTVGAVPEGFEPKPPPYGVSFTGLACSEAAPALRSRLPSSRRPDGVCRRLAPRDRADHSTRNGGAASPCPDR